jgi:hypothetical protein
MDSRNFPTPLRSLAEVYTQLQKECDAIDIIQKATEELKSISQNGFYELSNTFAIAGRSVYAVA